MSHDCITSGKGLSMSDSADMNLRKLREMVKDREAWRVAVYGVAKSWTRLSDWKTKKILKVESVDKFI